MPRFKWNNWNIRKVEAHSLSPSEVEAAFNQIISRTARKDGSYNIIAETPSGRIIHVIWRYDSHPDEVPDIFGEVEEPAIFVITAY